MMVDPIRSALPCNHLNAICWDCETNERRTLAKLKSWPRRPHRVGPPEEADGDEEHTPGANKATRANTQRQHITTHPRDLESHLANAATAANQIVQLCGKHGKQLLAGMSYGTHSLPDNTLLMFWGIASHILDA
jgi:hypothetical protein